MIKGTHGIQVLANVSVIRGANQDNICKNKLIGRVIEEYTSVINETMINNNKDNITNNNTYLILFIVFLIGFIMFLIGFIYYYRCNNANKKN